jgi:hypothetical protein
MATFDQAFNNTSHETIRHVPITMSGFQWLRDCFDIALAKVRGRESTGAAVLSAPYLNNAEANPPPRPPGTWQKACRPCQRILKSCFCLRAMIVSSLILM